MVSTKILVFLLGIIFLVVESTADSAGTAEMPYGLAYGGIPYGSVSGMVAKYQAERREFYPGLDYQKIRQQQQQQQQVNQPIIITPNVRAAGLELRQSGPFQIYKLPGVIAPGVVGTLSQIGY